MRIRARLLLAPLIAAVVVAGVAPGAAGQSPPDTLAIPEDDATLSNVALAVRILEATPFPEPVETVLVSRDDRFADALASGLLQDAAPLLLLPTDGPLPAEVAATLDRLAPGRAIVLGGTSAVSDGVVRELEDRGIAVQRRAGATRLETAAAIAATDAPAATTAILARAQASADSTDPTQAFADALAAGALAARTGWPILLTDTAALSPATRDHLAASAVEQVVVVGGAAAVSDAVLDQAAAVVGDARRVFGLDRAATAVAVAAELGAGTAADARRVVLVEGQAPDAWAGGFAAAGHAAAFDAPIILAAGDALPPASATWLEDGIGGDPAAGPVLTCITTAAACRSARAAAGLPTALSPDQRRRADQLVSAFENSTTELQYGYAENLGDGRGVTAGRAGFTTATCDALQVIVAYGEAVGDNVLAPFVPELERLCEEGSDQTDGLPEDEFIAAWGDAAEDPAFREAQDAVIDLEYFDPASTRADDLGLVTALARAQLYDTAIQHGVGEDPDGLDAIIERTLATAGTPGEAGEEAWLDAYFDTRLATLNDPANEETAEAWRGSVDRVECMRRIAEEGNYALEGPLTFTVYGDEFTVE